MMRQRRDKANYRPTQPYVRQAGSFLQGELPLQEQEPVINKPTEQVSLSVCQWGGCIH